MEDDPEEYGDVYSLTAMKSDTRLFLCHHEGGRSSEDAIELFSMVEQMRSTSSLTPVFTSDDWDPFAVGLLNVYGNFEVPPLGSQISSENRHSNLMSIYQIKTNPFKISVLAKKSITLQ